jgi:hypothetical protein
MWKYEVANTDHTLMQGVELINRWMFGEAEQTIGIKYESTLDGRNAARHERSHVAGSGDPKKMKELAELAGRGAGASHPGQVRSAEFTVKAIASAIEADPSTPLPSTPLMAGPSTSLRTGPLTPLMAGPSTSLTAGGPGDKLEAHVSEEELGVTTPLPEQEAAE